MSKQISYRPTPKVTALELQLERFPAVSFLSTWSSPVSTLWALRVADTGAQAQNLQILWVMSHREEQKTHGEEEYHTTYLEQFLRTTQEDELDRAIWLCHDEKCSVTLSHISWSYREFSFIWRNFPTNECLSRVKWWTRVRNTGH